MQDRKLYIAMVGLPARGKSTVANKLKHNLLKDGIMTRIFNNGDLRRRVRRMDTTSARFYSSDNKEGVALRERIALTNMDRAKRFLQGQGRVAILDATNVSLGRREKVSSRLNDHALMFVECLNHNAEILEASIQRKITLSEFSRMSPAEATRNFKKRIQYYKNIYTPLRIERNYIRLDSLNNRILDEELADEIPYYDRIRDFLVTDTVTNLFLIRHGETYFNLEDRIGGDSPLTENGKAQASAMALHFKRRKIPVIFTSTKKRTVQTAEPIQARQENCVIIPLREFDEINSGVCECMSYAEIREEMPEVYLNRKDDKYNYIYPGGEGYVTMTKRVDRGIKKALYLSGNAKNVMIIGHRAVNRMILSHFLYRRKEDVPYIYIPQDKFYHIVAAYDKKLFQLKKYA